MLKLIIFNTLLIALGVIGAILCSKYIKTEKGKRIALICAALGTIVCHYSSLLYHQFIDGTPMGFLNSNPNLILPIYPCNVVMWCCLILACLKFNSKTFDCLVDYVILFGIISALVGMFANIDYFRNPTLLDYDITKGIIAHAIMLFNVMLLISFKFFKLDLIKNMIHLLISIVGMYIIGIYCNLVFTVIGSAETAYNVNSMFILHSPFEGLNFLTYPIIAVIAIVLYFGILALCEQFIHKKGNRWYNKIKKEKVVNSETENNN